MGGEGASVTGAITQAAVIHPLQLPLWIDLTSVVVGALAGAGVAVREQLDIVGVLLLALVMGSEYPGT
ncbi:MAG TPA: TRIC cation channel family protein [Trebonia sp.]|nr:TRIC cation channel family protein [Trebonia sp.]